MSEFPFGPNYTIDLANISNPDIASLSNALTEHNAEIVNRINATTKEYLLKGEVPGHDPAFMQSPERQKMAQSRWYALLRSRLAQDSAKGSAISTLFPVAVYLYECYGLSPSKLILGYDVQTTLPSWLHGWLEQVSRLSAESYNELFDILDAGTATKCDVVFTMKDRLSEMAEFYGCRLRDFLPYPGILLVDTKMIYAFADATFQENDNPYPVIKPFLGNHKLLRLLICMCALYHVSPEYLLLQDYSEFAVTEKGRPYSPATRQLISRILTVDAATRTKAIGFVMAADADRDPDAGTDSLEQENAAQGITDESSPVNLMEAITTSTQTMKETEKQLVETLQKKILASMELSAEPVSAQKIFSLADGHSRLVRKALTVLENEGKIVRIPAQRSTPYWKLAPKKKK